MTKTESLFKHRIQVRVRNFEVDWQGIVHNAIYLQYFEIGRIEYLKSLGVRIDMAAVQKETRVVLVRNEIDYEAPARFDDVLNIHTRMRSIRTTSFCMEGMIEREATGELISRNLAYHVWLDPASDRPRPVPDEFRRLVERFEGKDCEILWPTIEI
jgi:acyl-CoA thioester hydrolase